MDIVWDKEKRLRNIDKHGCDFADLVEFEWENATFVDDTRKDYGERRVLAFGLFDGHLHIIAFTPRDDAVRVIVFVERTRERSRNMATAHKKKPPIYGVPDDDIPEVTAEQFRRARPIKDEFPE